MKDTFQIRLTTMRQQHINRNPRVISWDSEYLENSEIAYVTYDDKIDVPEILRVEARDLGLPCLAMPVRPAKKSAYRSWHAACQRELDRVVR